MFLSSVHITMWSDNALNTSSHCFLFMVSVQSNVVFLELMWTGHSLASVFLTNKKIRNINWDEPLFITTCISVSARFYGKYMPLHIRQLENATTDHLTGSDPWPQVKTQYLFSNWFLNVVSISLFMFSLLSSNSVLVHSINKKPWVLFLLEMRKMDCNIWTEFILLICLKWFSYPRQRFPTALYSFMTLSHFRTISLYSNLHFHRQNFVSFSLPQDFAKSRATQRYNSYTMIYHSTHQTIDLTSSNLVSDLIFVIGVLTISDPTRPI